MATITTPEIVVHTYEVDIPKKGKYTVESPKELSDAEAYTYALQQSKTEYSRGKEATRAVAGGLTLGFADELEAAARAARPTNMSDLVLGTETYGKRYTDIRNQLREQQKQYQTDRPAESLGYGLVGGLAMPFGAAKVGGTALKTLMTGKTGLGTLGRQTAASTGIGAVAGAGEAPEVKDIPKYSAIYGGVGAVAPAAVETVKIGGSAIRNVLQSTGILKSNPEVLANKKIVQYLNKENLTTEEVKSMLDEARRVGVPETTLADLGNNLQNLGYSSYVIPSKGKTEIATQLTARGESLPSKMVEGLVKKSNIQDTEFGFDYAQKLVSNQRALADKTYPTAYTLNVPAKPFQGYFDRKVMQNAYKKLEERADVRGETLPTLDQLKTAPALSTETLHKMKIGLDRVIEAETDAVTGKTSSYGKDVMTLKKEFNNKLKDLNPSYGKANEEFADEAKIQEAFKIGNNYQKLSESELKSKILKLNADEKEAFRVGMVSNIKNKLETFTGLDFQKQAFKSSRQKEAIKNVFNNPNEYADFMSQLDKQAKILSTNRKVLGGSESIERGIATEDVSNFADTLNAVRGNYLPAAMSLYRRGANYAQGINEPVSEALKQKMFMTSPRAQYSLLDELSKIQKTQPNKIPYAATGIAGSMPNLYRGILNFPTQEEQ